MGDELEEQLAALEANYAEKEKPKKSKKQSANRNLKIENSDKHSNNPNYLSVGSSTERKSNDAIKILQKNNNLNVENQQKVPEEKDSSSIKPSEELENEKSSSSKKPKPKKQASNLDQDVSKSQTSMPKKLTKVEEERKKRSAMIKKIKEQQDNEQAIRKQKEEEEEARLEKLHQERLEKERIAKEKKERKRQKEKEKIAQSKREGKFLTEKQKQNKARFEHMLKAVGQEELLLKGDKESQPLSKKNFNIRKKRDNEQDEDISKDVSATNNVNVMDKENMDDEDDLSSTNSDDWERVYEKEFANEIVSLSSSGESDVEIPIALGTTKRINESVDVDENPFAVAERIIKREHDRCEAIRSTDNLRAPIICVLGHVDTGKTKLLDKLRNTNVQDCEAGGITQQIGATNVPADNIKEATKQCVDTFDTSIMKLPGLLIIDTPGHESFGNLRDRGSSLCDLAILVVDIMHSIQRQTIESIQLLRKRKTPFVVALNKIDRLTQFNSNSQLKVEEVLKQQSLNTRYDFEDRVKKVKSDFSIQSINTRLFYEEIPQLVKNNAIESYEDDYICLVPTSAHTGDGMADLLTYLCQYSQEKLDKRLSFSEELQALTMEVKEIQGMGTTLDVILINGTLREGDTIVVAGQEAPIVTQIRALLQPAPMRDLRVKNAYDHFKEIKGAQGVKICAQDLQKALAGLPLYVSHDPILINYYSEKIEANLESVLKSFKTADIGLHVQASTLGSLEALLTFLKSEGVPYSTIGIGPIHKKDVIKCAIMNERGHPQWSVILGFDVKVERDAQEMAEKESVKIFIADIIYTLHDKLLNYIKEQKASNKEKNREIAIFPVKFYILPDKVFCQRAPIIVGVRIDGGQLRVGTPLCVPDRNNLEIGKVASMEINHNSVTVARKGEEVCVRIEPSQGDTPKLYGRHFDDKDIIVSLITRQSINALRDHFRDEVDKEDWKLLKKLKELQNIL